MNFDDLELDAAMEGIFCDPETTVRGLLDKVRTNLRNNYNSLDAAETLAQKMQAEGGEIRQTLLGITNTMAKIHNGAMGKEEALAIVEPAIKAVKAKCTALGLADTFCDDNDVCETELQMLLEFITGCDTVMDEHLKALREEEGSDLAGKAATLAHGAENQVSTESTILQAMMNGDTEAMEYLVDRAARAVTKGWTPEGIGGAGNAIRQTTEFKTAQALYKQARALKKTAPEKAISTMKKAKELYMRLYKKASGLIRNANKGKTHQSMNTDNSGSIGIMGYLEDRIDACDAFLMKMGAAGNKGEIRSLKASLKGERAMAKSDYKNRKGATEAMYAFDLARQAAANGDVNAATEALIAGYLYTNDGEISAASESMMAIESMVELMKLNDDLDIDLGSF